MNPPAWSERRIPALSLYFWGGITGAIMGLGYGAVENSVEWGLGVFLFFVALCVLCHVWTLADDLLRARRHRKWEALMARLSQLEDSDFYGAEFLRLRSDATKNLRLFGLFAILGVISLIHVGLDEEQGGILAMLLSCGFWVLIGAFAAGSEEIKRRKRIRWLEARVAEAGRLMG